MILNLFGTLGGEDPLGEGMATHFSILAWTEEPDALWTIAKSQSQLKQLAHTRELWVYSGLLVKNVTIITFMGLKG